MAFLEFSSKPFFLFPIGTSSVATTPGDHALSVGSSPPSHVGSNLVATPTHPSMMPIPRKVSLGGHSLNSVGSSYCGSASSSCSTTLNRSHAPASHAPQSHHHHNHHHHHHVHHNPAASGVPARHWLWLQRCHLCLRKRGRLWRHMLRL